MQSFFQVLSFIQKFDLASILKSIAFPFVFVFVCYSELIEYFTSFNMDFKVFTPQPIVHPALLINEDLQKLTVKNLREFGNFKSKVRKQDMIEALLSTI